MKYRWLFAALAIIWIIGGWILWNDWNNRSGHTLFAAEEQLLEQPPVQQTVSSSATIGMVGDILLHKPMYTYEEFDFAFAAVKTQMEGIDFLLANQESMPGGKELGLSTYPKFNSPKHIIPALQNAGVDMITLANNHTFDKGETGVLNAIRHAKEYGMPYVGAYDSFDDRTTQRIVDVNGIRFGVVSYTYDTNVPMDLTGREYLVNFIKKDRIERDIRLMKPNADVIVVSMHWGPEYSIESSETQRELAEFAAEAGADIIFGHHPHVLQPYGEVGGAKVFYSLGNFYSGQPFEYTNFGGIARLTVHKEAAGEQVDIAIEDPRLFPTAVTKNEYGRLRVVPLRETNHLRYDEEWVENHVGVPSW